MANRGPVLRALLLCASPLATWCGCTITIDDGGSNDGGGKDQLTIRVANASDVALDPQIYVSAELVSVDELFADANRYAHFGVGSLGVLESQGTAEFTLDCPAAAMIGTRGGQFGDDLSSPEGSGRQVVLTRDQSFFCGGTVTFSFARSGGGFTTQFDVSP